MPSANPQVSALRFRDLRIVLSSAPVIGLSHARRCVDIGACDHDCAGHVVCLRCAAVKCHAHTRTNGRYYRADGPTRLARIYPVERPADCAPENPLRPLVQRLRHLAGSDSETEIGTAVCDLSGFWITLAHGLSASYSCWRFRYSARIGLIHSGICSSVYTKCIC